MRGNPVSVASVASTLEAETVTPPTSASLPSSKVFTNEDYKNFLKGYKSQVEEHDYWIEDDMIQGIVSAPCAQPLGSGDVSTPTRVHDAVASCMVQAKSPTSSAARC